MLHNLKLLLLKSHDVQEKCMKENHWSDFHLFASYKYNHHKENINVLYNWLYITIKITDIKVSQS